MGKVQGVLKRAASAGRTQASGAAGAPARTHPLLQKEEQYRDRPHAGQRRKGDNRVAEDGIGFVLHRKNGDQDGGGHRRLQDAYRKLIVGEAHRQANPPARERHDGQLDDRGAHGVQYLC